LSKIAISGASTGTATFTIESPATSTNRTLTLPDNTGTIITQNSTPAFASTIGVGGATAAASGAGITFPATQSASSDVNTLDDYEEGTFTPTFSATSSDPTVTYAANGQRGYYAKIGSIVYFQAFLNNSTISGGSGDLILGGLPFTVGGDVSTLRTWGNILVGTNGVDWGASKTALVGYARGGTTSAYVLSMQNNSSWAGIPIGNVANGDEMVWSGWYIV